MSAHNSVLKGIGGMAILTVSSKLVRLVVLMVTARFLTPEDFGVVAAFSMVFAFAHLVAGMGIVRAIIQRPIINSAHIGSAIAFSSFIGLCITIIMFFISGAIAELMKIEELLLPLQVSSFTFTILGFSNVCSAIYQREGKVVFIGKLQAIGTVFGSIFITVPLLYFDVGYWAIIIGLLVAELISLIGIIFFGWKKLYFKPYKKELFEIIKYSTAFFFNNTIGLLSQQIDIAIVSRYLGAMPLGNYSRAMQLVEFPHQIYWMVIDRVVFPIMSSMKENKLKLINFFTKTLSLLGLVLIMGVLVLSIGSKEIVFIMLGPNWGTVAEILKILAFAVFFRSISAFIDSFLAAYNLVKVLTIKQLISLATFMLFLSIGIEYGIQGVAFAVVAAGIVRFIYSVFAVIIFTELSFKNILFSLLPAILSSAFIMFFYYLFNGFLLKNGFVGIVFGIIVFMVFCIFKPISLFVSPKGVFIINEGKLRVKEYFLNKV